MQPAYGHCGVCQVAVVLPEQLGCLVGGETFGGGGEEVGGELLDVVQAWSQVLGEGRAQLVLDDFVVADLLGVEGPVPLDLDRVGEPGLTAPCAAFIQLVHIGGPLLVDGAPIHRDHVCGLVLVDQACGVDDAAVGAFCVLGDGQSPGSALVDLFLVAVQHALLSLTPDAGHVT